MSSNQDGNIEPAKRALASVPALGAPDLSTITPLNGLTNHVYRIDTEAGAFCLRIPGEGTEAIIDRVAEEVSARAAAEVGVGPEVLHFDADGVMVTRCVEGSMLSPEQFRHDPSAVERAADALRRLHSSAHPFAREFRVFEIMDRYASLLRDRGVQLALQERSLVERADAIRLILEAKPVPFKPCHCDPTGGNLIDSGDRVWLIDWEYSGMNDPAWDLAYLSLEAGFDLEQDRQFLGSYFGRVPLAPEAARVGVYKGLCDLLSGLWALIQHMNGNRSADFIALAEKTFKRCRERMLSERFADDIRTLGDG